MSRSKRACAILIGSVLVLVLGSSFLVAGTVASGRLVTVRVQESGPDGIDLFVPVPAGVVEAALVLTPTVLESLDTRSLDRARHELDHLMPALETVLEALDELPNATLVEVEGRDEYVRVRKVRDALEIRVEDDDVDVAVSVPLSVLRAVGTVLAN